LDSALAPFGFTHLVTSVNTLKLATSLACRRFVRLQLPEIGLHQKQALSYWDALIVASAHIAGCSVLLTEDMGTSKVLAGVKLFNPFASS
jgi:predicted nucleic acid-binding protein